jgi:type I restriction enzyme S subunit
MSRIHDLIAEHCPNGVAFKRLGDIVRIKNGKDHKSLGEGKFPVYGSGGIMRYADAYAYNKPSVLIPRKGSLGNLFFVDVPFWTVDTIFYTEIDENQIRPKYLYYYLTTVGLGDMNQAGGVPSQTQSVLNELSIPIPCSDNPKKSLEIQAEIVRILDAFTSLTAELTARKKQYNHYRDQLLRFEDGEVEWQTLGELTTLRRGRVMSKGYLAENAGPFPVFSSQTANNGMIGKIDTFDFDGEFISWTTDGANAGTVFHRTGKFSITNVCGLIKINDESKLNYKFLYYWLSVEAQKHVYSGMGNPKLMSHQVEKIPVPIPCPASPEKSLEKQKRIVSILDKLEALTFSISEGLPREIELRQKQYAYYRDLLLSFPKPEEVAA